MLLKSSIKSSSNLLTLRLAVPSMLRNCSSKIASKSPEQYAITSIIATQIEKIQPIKTRQATDTKNCGSISSFPVITRTTPLIVCRAITAQ